MIYLRKYKSCVLGERLISWDLEYVLSFAVYFSFIVSVKTAQVSFSNVLISQSLITLSQRFIVPYFVGCCLHAIMLV